MSSSHDSAAILTELLPLEPIFHTAAFGTTLEDFANRMADDYWEVGASGRTYDRAFILHHLQQEPPLSAAQEGWQVKAPTLRCLAEHLYLLTYTLHQGDRVTRRSTLWQQGAQGWQILYHQGTIVGSHLTT